MLSQGVSLGQSITTFSFGFAPFMIFVATFLVKHPAWKIKRFDIVCGALSLLGLVLWWLTGEGNVAIVFSIFADLLGFMPTLVKSFTHPESESPWTFMLSEVSTVIGLMVVSSWNFEHVAFPVYIFMANALAIAFIYFKAGTRILEWRRRHKLPDST
jgi:4-amino-4-deoxy-L-arabinose transferase-like glycosyltransferase